ncbi:MAG: inositol monophosphatase [Bacteroidales bacterium]|nr:inositol monophosphatase [Bacteroidales bacterium]
MDYKELCHQVCLLAMEVGDYLREERLGIEALAVEAKGVHDYVTQFDKESERRIVERLRALLPESGFIAEEGTASQKGGEKYVWIVDPLDGTTNFIHGLPVTCVSIGLREGKEMAMGVVYELWAKECFYAYKGSEGAYLNGKAIHVSAAQRMNDSMIATGFPYTQFDRMPQYMRYLEWTMRNTHGVRRLGSAAADLVYTACGRCDGFYEYGLKPYDVAAGAYIVERAGGKVSDFEGEDNWLFGGEIIASNPLIFEEMRQSLHSHLSKPQGIISTLKARRKKR